MIAQATCEQCGRTFDAIREGKTRRAETFCSIECADKAHPDMAYDRALKDIYCTCGAFYFDPGEEGTPLCQVHQASLVDLFGPGANPALCPVTLGAHQCQREPGHVGYHLCVEPERAKELMEGPK